MNVRLIYLGTKGGGAEFFRELRNLSYGSEEHLIQYVSADKFVRGYDEPQISKADFVIPGVRTILRRPWFLYRFIRICFSLSKSSSEFINIFLMPSPLDAILFRTLKLRGEKCIFLIHDATPHPGEIWPRKKSISWRIHNADGVIFLSEHVRCQVRSRFNLKNTLVLDHPAFNSITKLSENMSQERSSDRSLPKMLFIGRIRKYKGISQLVLFQELIQGKFQLVIAGEGKLPKGLKDIEIHNYWLSEFEMSRLLTTAEVLIFPYLEASQSGIIPIAMKLNKVLIISKIDGLVEQVQGYPRVFSFTLGDRESFRNALSESEANLLNMRNSKNHSGHNPTSPDFVLFYRDLMAFVAAI